jgi:hypothetical protein
MEFFQQTIANYVLSYHQNNLTHSAQCDQVIFICSYTLLHVSILSKSSSEGPSTLNKIKYDRSSLAEKHLLVLNVSFY